MSRPFGSPLRPGRDDEKGRRCRTACKPGSVRAVLARDGHSSGTRLAARLARPTRAAGREPPRSAPFGDDRPPLFGLAPGGVYRAAPVTGSAVRSCRTLSPLPADGIGRARAVCFLWHCPWGRPRRPLTGTVFPWSPDFPPIPGWGPAAVRPSGALSSAMGHGRSRWLRRSADRLPRLLNRSACICTIQQGRLRRTWSQGRFAVIRLG